MKKITGFIRIFLYITFGLILIIGEANDAIFVTYNLNLIVGIPLLIGSLSHLYSDFKRCKYKSVDNFFGGEIIIAVLSILAIFYPLLKKSFEEEIIFICIVWGVIAILNGSRDFSHVIYYINSKEPYIYSLIESIIMIILALLLILDPLEHVKLHIIVLGIEFLIEAAEVCIHTFIGKKSDTQN
jgi:uncharacterized membrane protein HdeD (DUF308 family)